MTIYGRSRAQGSVKGIAYILGDSFIVGLGLFVAFVDIIKNIEYQPIRSIKRSQVVFTLTFK